MVSQTPVTSRLRYEMSSYLDYAFGTDSNSFLLQRALQLPRGYNPRTLELGLWALEILLRADAQRHRGDYRKHRDNYDHHPPPC